jgi:hypothetical protein
LHMIYYDIKEIYYDIIEIYDIIVAQGSRWPGSSPTVVGCRRAASPGGSKVAWRHHSTLGGVRGRRRALSIPSGDRELQ